jgi:POT family proton-dependent oligopeptide transporter
MSEAVVKRKQPKALGLLFFAEMWERFSFYGMKGLLVLYLTNELFAHVESSGARDRVAFGIFGAYATLVYATPFIGGLLADRVLGQKRAVILGGVLMAIGHIVMAIENEFCLYLALAFLIAGNGFFKPNISTMVGGLYEENDERRDAGFTIFYMGINLGALLQLIPGYLGQTYTWGLGFGLAGAGMIIGLAVFWFGRGMLGANGDPPDVAKLTRKIAGPLSLEWLIYIGAFLSVGVFALFVAFNGLMHYLVPPATILGFAVVFVYALMQEKVARERLFAALILLVFAIVFFTFFEQGASSMSLFTDRNVDRVIFDRQIPASVFQSVNPAMIVILGLPFSALWLFLERRHMDLSIPSKFALGLALVGLGFLAMAWLGEGYVFPGRRPGEGDEEGQVFAAALVPLSVLFLGYLLHTAGELCLSPIGLSMITKLAPKKIVAMMMGLWFLATAASEHLAALIATFTAVDTEEGTAGVMAREAGILPSGDHAPALLESYDQLAAYLTTFEPIGYTAIVAGVLLFVLGPLIKKWQHGVT